ncbi:hypothetical protein STEG23_024347, partial [Scotinomys teguina]
IRKKVEYEAEILLLQKLKIKNNNYLKQLYKQAYHIGGVYYVARHKTEEIENEISDVRRKFKAREEFLRKLTRGEMAAGVAIQKRLYSIEETQFLEMQEFIRRKALYALALTEVELPLRKIEADAVRIRLLHRRHSQMLQEIREKQEVVRKKVGATKKNLRSKSKKRRKELTKTEEKVSIIHQEIDFTRSKTIVLNAKSKELCKEIKIMKLEKINFEDKLNKLKDEFMKLRFDREHVQGVFDHLNLEKQHCEERIFEEDNLFRKLAEMRQSTLANIQVQKFESVFSPFHCFLTVVRQNTTVAKDGEGK